AVAQTVVGAGVGGRWLFCANRGGQSNGRGDPALHSAASRRERTATAIEIVLERNRGGAAMNRAKSPGLWPGIVRFTRFLYWPIPPRPCPIALLTGVPDSLSGSQPASDLLHVWPLLLRPVCWPASLSGHVAWA